MASVYSAGDFRNGTTFEMEGNVYRIVEFQHVKPGKGSAFVDLLNINLFHILFILQIINYIKN